MAHYLDTSALAKLVVAEPETKALRTWLLESERTAVSSDLARTELMRAVRRAAPERTLQARTVLESITMLQVSTSTYEAAGRLDPAILRTLDALHLASALTLGDDLESLVTYDGRLAEAARANGVPAVSPS